jgi:hypothetical protein
MMLLQGAQAGGYRPNLFADFLLGFQIYHLLAGEKGFHLHLLNKRLSIQGNFEKGKEANIQNKYAV